MTEQSYDVTFESKKTAEVPLTTEEGGKLSPMCAGLARRDIGGLPRRALTLRIGVVRPLIHTPKPHQHANR